MDDDLRDLELKVEHGDSFDRYRYRIALIRAGYAEKAGLAQGDEVLVEEFEHAWIRGKWRGTIVDLFSAGDCRVRPDKSEQNWKVKVTAEFFDKGLYLTHDDKVVVCAPNPNAEGIIWTKTSDTLSATTVCAMVRRVDA